MWLIAFILIAVLVWSMARAASIADQRLEKINQRTTEERGEES